MSKENKTVDERHEEAIALGDLITHFIIDKVERESTNVGVVVTAVMIAATQITNSAIVSISEQEGEKKAMESIMNIRSGWSRYLDNLETTIRAMALDKEEAAKNDQ